MAGQPADERYGIDRRKAMDTGDGPWIPLPAPGSPAGSLTGIWRSSYELSSGRSGGTVLGEHYVAVIEDGGKLTVRSLPRSAASRLKMDLAVNGRVVTGTWAEQTNPDGPYQGAVYAGAVQLLQTADCELRGAWLGYGSDDHINTGPWTLTMVEAGLSEAAVDRWNRPPGCGRRLENSSTLVALGKAPSVVGRCSASSKPSEMLLRRFRARSMLT